jgi:hypothetical protein
MVMDTSLTHAVTGLAVITHDEAYLFTDGRYFLQAEQQLDRYEGLQLHMLTPDVAP